MDNSYPPILSKTKLKKLQQAGWELPSGDAIKACTDDFVVLRRKVKSGYEFMILNVGLRGELRLLPNGTFVY